MPRIAILTLLVAALAACTPAKAKQYDSGNPVHCMTIFGATSGTLRTGPLADELNARIAFIARANGGPQWLREVTPTTRQLAATWEASPDEKAVVQLFEECRNRQDEDPGFSAAWPELIQLGRRISSTPR